MRAHLALAALALALTAQAPPAAAAPLANVRGFDARLLAGKTCQGIFDSGRKRFASKGAEQLVFAVAGDRLAAQFSRLVGPAAHDPAEYAMSLGRPIDTSRYEPLGPVRDLTVSGNKIRYIDPLGARVELTYGQGTLSGQSDPRGGSDPRMTRVQFVNLICR